MSQNDKLFFIFSGSVKKSVITNNLSDAISLNEGPNGLAEALDRGNRPNKSTRKYFFLFFLSILKSG